jgi:hypothetical protein
VVVESSRAGARGSSGLPVALGLASGGRGQASWCYYIGFCVGFFLPLRPGG